MSSSVLFIIAVPMAYPKHDDCLFSYGLFIISKQMERCILGVSVGPEDGECSLTCAPVGLISNFYCLVSSVSFQKLRMEGEEEKGDCIIIENNK